ncbi:3-deoxy-D-manno-octulosonic acid transferase [Flaviaesturariibacter flavus]|uniref:3-deoxy-D-manno-octulosonic acid transferase n=1 Tax=Flaviaesturariibacter flavus TaxID=2502780 RepID=UPI001FB4C18F|nr:glycosyltransferase N-terminal domain-containing protein [Flaviaesturariibacter flavus]
MLIYVVFIRLYALAIRIAARFNGKARAWVEGRRNWHQHLQKALAGSGAPVIWMHSASAGEFEQGKPVLEALRQQYPQHRILVTFFSPSGYEVGVKYKGADIVTYLPLDTAANAERFVDTVRPALVVFVKYDYWYYHLNAVCRSGTPLLLVSAIFQPRQAFFKWYGGVHRRMLTFFTWLFVQDEASVQLLQSIGVTKCSAAGDTRFDRVAHITSNPAPLPPIEDFVKGDLPVLVAGSTWAEDEELLNALGDDLKLVIVPHEIDDAHIRQLTERFSKRVTLTYTGLLHEGCAPPSLRVVIINNFGMLSRLYRYAHITYIGGGFNKSGIHNTLEAAAWGKPVLFGPNYQKFREAKGLIGCGAARSVSNAEELKKAVSGLLANPAELDRAGLQAARYVQDNIGATGRILRYIQENRLLTNA